MGNGGGRFRNDEAPQRDKRRGEEGSICLSLKKSCQLKCYWDKFNPNPPHADQDTQGVSMMEGEREFCRGDKTGEPRTSTTNQIRCHSAQVGIVGEAEESHFIQ